MKRSHLVLLVVIITLFSGYVNAISNESLHLLDQQGQRQEAIGQANHYLQSYPHDVDVRLTLAQFYFEEKKYQEARAELLIVLTQAPSYTDALLVLINCDIELFNYEEALRMANYGLLFNPLDPDLLKKRVVLESLQPTEYQQLKTLYAQGEYRFAMKRALDYLQAHANDADVRLLLGQIYFAEKDYPKAQQQLKQVLQQVPNYKDAMLILMNADIELKQFKEAKAIAKQGLVYYPHDKVLGKKLTDIESLQHPPVKRKPMQQPLKLEVPPYANEVGLYQQNYYISDVRQTWNYSTFYYAYKGEWGRIYGKVNYDTRLGFKGTQEEVEAFPILSKNLYLELQAAVATEPNLFPEHLYGGEAYVNLPKFIDFSGGAKYNFIESNHQFWLFTGSLSKQVNQHLLTYRPNYYSPNRGHSSLLHLINYRYFIRDPNLYVGMIYGRGTSPDLANLTTIDFLVTDNEIFSPYVNFSLFQDRLIVNASFYYQNQYFFSLFRLRKWSGGTISLAWKF